MKISKNKNTGKWDIDFHCNNRRIQKRGFITRADAESYKTKIEYNLKFKKHGLPKEEKIRFIELAQRYLENYSKPNKSSFKTDISLMKPLVEYFGSPNIGDITTEDIDLYRNERIHVRIRKGKKYPEGKLISQTTIKTAWNTLLKRSGIKDLRFHDLRHTFVTYTLLRGADLIHFKETPWAILI